SLAADAPGTASFSFGQFEPKGFVALSTEESAVRVEIVTEESPAWSAPPQAAGSVAAPRGSPRDVARNVEPFEELAGAGADAVVVYLRTRNFFRREFVRWLGVVAQTRLLSDPASKHSMNRGRAQSTSDLRGYQTRSSRGRSGSRCPRPSRPAAPGRRGGARPGRRRPAGCIAGGGSSRG